MHFLSNLITSLSNANSAKLNSISFKISTKNEFRNTLYLFHNMVNARRQKPLYNYGNINVYQNLNIANVFNNFVSVYNTKGNMKLLTESFQRSLIIKDLKKWLMNNINSFK